MVTGKKILVENKEAAVSNRDDASSPRIQLSQLTFSRFIAAIAIVIFHFTENVFPFRISFVSNIAVHFNVLVSYFFVLSGFLLTLNVKNKMDAPQYYINRFSRIYPLYLFALLLTLFLIFNARTPKETISFDKVFLSLLLVQSWSKDYAMVYNFPAWSLSVEAFFYLIFPLVIFLFRNIKLRQQLFYTIGFWCIMQVLFVAMILQGKSFVFANPLFHLSTFVLGIGAGMFFKSKYRLLITNIQKLEWLSTALIMLIAYLVVSKNGLFQQFYLNGMLAPVFVVLIYTLALSKKKIIRAFSNPRLQYLGEISYGIYILQFPVSILVFGVMDRTLRLSQTPTFYIYVAALIAFSAACFEIIEKPCRALLRNKPLKKRLA